MNDASSQTVDLSACTGVETVMSLDGGSYPRKGIVPRRQRNSGAAVARRRSGSSGVTSVAAGRPRLAVTGGAVGRGPGRFPAGSHGISDTLGLDPAFPGLLDSRKHSQVMECFLLAKGG